MSSTERSPRRQAAFTLIEIMAVVLIIGLLASIVGVQVISQIDRARVGTAKTQIKQLESAFAFYHMDNGRYPTTEQGLAALIEKPASAPEPRNYRAGGYLQGGAVPLDPWGQPFQYQSPGTHNPGGFDLWSLGADGAPGGNDSDSDIGNWVEAESTS
jgi:general secretion pathway protein G